MFQLIQILACSFIYPEIQNATFNMNNYLPATLNSSTVATAIIKKINNTERIIEIGDPHRSKRTVLIYKYTNHGKRIYNGIYNPVLVRLKTTLTETLEEMEKYSKDKKAKVQQIYYDNMSQALCILLNMNYNVFKPAEKYLKESFFSEKSAIMMLISEFYCYESFEKVLQTVFNENKILPSKEAPSGQILTSHSFNAKMPQLVEFEKFILEKFNIALNLTVDHRKEVDQVIEKLTIFLDSILVNVAISRQSVLIEFQLLNFSAIDVRNAFLEEFKNSINMGKCKCVSKTATEFSKNFKKEFENSPYYKEKKTGLCTII